MLRNFAVEPEVEELCAVINRMGGAIDGIGTDTLTIEGKDRLSGIVHTVMPDRIEAGTYLIAGAITKGSVEVTGCRPAHLSALLEQLSLVGVKLEIDDQTIRVISNGLPVSADVQTNPYPGFATDFQAQFIGADVLGPINSE